MSSPHLRRNRIALPLLLAALACPLAAQEVMPGGPVVPNNQPRAIPETAVLARASETEGLVARAGALSRQDPVILAIATALEGERDVLDRYEQDLATLDAATVSQRTLSDQRERWQRADLRIQAALEELRGRWQDLVEMRDRIRFERETWILTQAALQTAALGPEMLARITELSAETDRVFAELTPPIEVVTDFINRANRRRDQVAEAIDEIDRLLEETRDRVFRRDGSPLWRTPPRGLSNVGAEIQSAGRYWWRTSLDWSRGHAGQLLALGVIFVLLVGAALGLARLRPRWPDEPSFDVPRFVVSRPFALGSLAALAVGVFLLDPISGPALDVFRLVVAIAVTRLAPGLAGPLPRVAVHGTVGLYVLVIVVGVVPGGSIIGRLLLLAIALVGSAIAYRSLRLWPVDGGRIWNLSRAGMPVIGVLLLSGAVANILGWISLGQTLVTATVNASLAAIAWMLVVRAAAGLLPLVQANFVTTDGTDQKHRRQQFENACLIPLTILAGYAWVDGALRTYGIMPAVDRWAKSVLGWSLAVGSLEISVGGVAGATLIMVVTTFLARIVRFILADGVFPRMGMRAGTVSTLVSLINYVIITIGAVMAATAAGFNATQLTVVLGAMSVGIGFGLQAVVGNFVSGLILMFERPVAVGDQVEVGGFLGKIAHIGIRASRVRTFDGSDVIIPNSELVTKQVVNWTLMEGTRRLALEFAVGLDSDPKTVMSILEATGLEHELVLPEPAPKALMMGYGDSAINFRLLVWLRVENLLTVQSDLHLVLIERLRAAGVEVPAVRRERHQAGPPA